VRDSSAENRGHATPLQQGLMATSMRSRGSYLNQQIFHVPAHEDSDRFQEAWRRAEEAFPAMRARIVSIEDRGEFQVTTSSSSRWSESEDLEEYLEWDIDLGVRYGGLLSRFGLVPTPKDGDYVVWTAHHAIYDGWTVRNILAAVEMVYNNNGVVLDKAPSLATFVKHLLQRNIAEENEYWRRTLSGTANALFPAPASPVQPLASNGFCQRLVAMPTPFKDVTVSALIQAAWALALAQQTSCDDVVFGLVLSGRDTPVADITTISGPTLTTVPRRLKVNTAMKVNEYLLEVQRSGTEMLSHVHAGLHNITRISEHAKQPCNFRKLLVIQPRETQIDESSLFWNGGGSQTDKTHLPLSR
jgi:hypothetical protein